MYSLDKPVANLPGGSPHADFSQGISGELEMLYNWNQGSLNEGKTENS